MEQEPLSVRTRSTLMPCPAYQATANHKNSTADSAVSSGKIVIPFATHGGSGFSDAIETIAGLQPKAHVVREDFTISRNRMEQAESGVAEWLKKLGFKR